jgi:predicted dehydrogenase
MMAENVRVAVVGGGLMGREVASAFGRWFAMEDCPVKPELVAVADVNEAQLDWFRQVPGVKWLVSDYRELLQNPEIDVFYVAVPHQLHEEIYGEVLAAGKDLLAEKPFGIDLAAAKRIAGKVGESGCFVRCSSEFPFMPGVQRFVKEVRNGEMGRILEINAGYVHSSDLDPGKPGNWKRQVPTCGEIGVMGDLGMHVVHVPLRLGWNPQFVHAQLQRGYPERPDGRGGVSICDTWDNAALHTGVEIGGETVPMRLEMKRLAPGETDSWSIEVLGTEGGARFSSKDPKAFWTFRREEDQLWRRTDLGFGTAFKTITGGIFGPGFPDLLMQMWAAYLAERAGQLGDRFGCATVEEAVRSHELFAAALASQEHQAVERLF